jgi:hypothetical protein
MKGGGLAVVLLASLAFRPLALAASPPAIPSKVTLTFHQGDKLKPLPLRAPDGRVFEFSWDGSSELVDLTLFRPGHKASATNLLEPKGRWRGAEPFGLVAGEFDPGAESIWGRHRDIPVRNYPFKLHVEILDAQSGDMKDNKGLDREVFKTLVLTAELRPAQ